MNRAEILDEMKSGSFGGRLESFHEMRDHIVRYADVVPLSPEVRQLLEERLAESDANPDDVMTWEEIKESLKRPVRPS